VSGGVVHLSLGRVHLRGAHFGSACHEATAGSARSHIISALFFNPLKVLLILNLFLNILVTLQNLVVLDFTFLQALVHSQLESLLVGRHFVGLLLHELGLTG